MKKITRCALAIGIIFSSCQKETQLARNWYSPDFPEFDCLDPVMTGESGTIGYTLEENLTDAQLVMEIKQRNSLPDYMVIWLDPATYSGDAENPNPEYLAFPLHVSSMSNEWGWDYYEEYKADKQAFLDKYTNGQETGGMKYCSDVMDSYGK